MIESVDYSKDASSARAHVRERVSDFLYQEAELLDSHDYDGWLGLWTTDGIYWIPANEDDYDPRLHISIIYDDRNRIEERCIRLSSGVAHSQEPHSRLCHLLGNIQIAEQVDPQSVKVTCKMLVLELRSGTKTVYGARCEYDLVDSDYGYRMRMKKVILIDNDEPLVNLSFLL